MLGIGHAIGQKWVYDQHYGVALAKRFHYNKPPTILDAPAHMDGRRSGFRIRKRRLARAASASLRSRPVAAPVLNAISAAVGDEVFRRAPVTLDGILTALEMGRPTQAPLTANV